MCHQGNVEQAISVPPAGWRPARASPRNNRFNCCDKTQQISPAPGGKDRPASRLIFAVSLMRPQSRGFERSALALRHTVDGEFLYRFAKETMKIEPCGKMEEHPAETDRRPVHEH